MDKSTLSNYGWIVIVTLVLAVMLAFATPFGTYVGKGASNVIKTFVQSSDNAIDEDNIDVQSQNWDEYLKADTSQENNHSKHIEKSNVETGYKSQITTEKSDNYLMEFFHHDYGSYYNRSIMFWDIKDYDINKKAKLIFESSYPDTLEVIKIDKEEGWFEVTSNQLKALDVSEKQDGSVVAYITGNENEIIYHIAGKDGVVMTNPNSSKLFAGIYLDEIDFNNCFNTSEMVYALEMFDTNRFVELDLSSWDVSSLEEMRYMFNANEKLKKIILPSFLNAPINDLCGLFMGCKSLEYIDLTNFNTENVMFFGQMFASCENLKEIDISSFDTRKGIDFNSTFSSCKSLQKIYGGENCVIPSGANTKDMWKNCPINTIIV